MPVSKYFKQDLIHKIPDRTPGVNIIAFNSAAEVLSLTALSVLHEDIVQHCIGAH